MTIFQLLLYSCVVSNGLDGEVLSKTCRWDTRSLYAQAAHCSGVGLASVGHPIFSDIYEDRKVEMFKCAPVSVEGRP